MPLIPVVAIVLAKNESAGIRSTLSHLGDFAEVVVVDSGSTDATADIARTAGASVVNFNWDGKYPKKKQWSLDNVSTAATWVLLLDADEYPSPELVQEIRALVSGPQASLCDAYDIQLRYKFGGRFLRHGHKVTKRSLLNRRTTRFPDVDDLGAPGIREVEGHYQPQTAGRVGRLQGELVHDDKDPVASWFDRHNRYSDWEAYLRLSPKTRFDIAEKRSANGRRFERIPLKPAAFFLYGFVVRLGFLDGRAGFDYHLALAMYYWQIEVKVRELHRATARVGHSIGSHGH